MKVSESYMSHFVEMRKRLIFSVIALAAASLVVYLNMTFVFNFLSSAFQETAAGKKEIFYARDVFDGFATRVRLALTVGALLSFPVFLYNFLAFIFPAIGKRAQRIILISLILGFLIALFSSYFSLFYLIPFAVQSLTSSAFIPNRVGLLLDYSRSIMLPITLTIWIMIVFEIPLIMLVLMILNILKRKFVLRLIFPIIVLIFILSAVITPPDIITQISVALPLTFLMLLTLLIAKIFNFGSNDV